MPSVPTATSRSGPKAAFSGGLGIAAPFWINALSNFAVIGALLWWRPPVSQGSRLPPERLAGALVIGFRHARYYPNLRATLARAVSFFFFASAYWALLPLVARNQIAGGPELYGILLGAIGVGAVIGAFTLPSQARLASRTASSSPLATTRR